MTEIATVPVPEKLYHEVCAQSARVEEALTNYNAAAERAKGAKKYLDAAQETLHSLIKRFTAPEADMPLFANQSDAIAAAQADPVVTTLVERLLARGHDVNALIVAGYTQDERADVATYLDILDANEAERARVDGTEEAATLAECEVPAFLLPQPLTAIEIADLVTRLDQAGWTRDASDVEAWTAAQVADVRAWLAAVDAVKAEKGDAITADDFPPAPSWLGEAEPLDEATAAQVAAIANGDAEPPADDEQADAPADEARPRRRRSGKGRG